MMIKKLLLTATSFVAIVFSACAQNIDASKVPAAVKASFQKKYPGVTGKWEKEGGKYEVNFKQNANTVSLLVEPTGAITETETDLRIADLPAPALSYVKEHYRGKTIRGGTKIAKADSSVNYEVEVAGTDVIFDVSGKFLKEIKE